MKAHQISMLAIFAFCFLLLSCKDDESTQAGENVCDRVSVSNNQPSIRMDCNNITGSVSNIQYDQFGRVASFDFNWKCNTSSEQYTGRFYNIQYNSIAQIQSFQATVNGKSCSWPR